MIAAKRGGYVLNTALKSEGTRWQLSGNINRKKLLRNELR
jgi:hypothetical protein